MEDRLESVDDESLDEFYSAESFFSIQNSPEKSPKSSQKNSPENSPPKSPQKSPKSSPKKSPEKSPEKSPKKTPIPILEADLSISNEVDYVLVILKEKLENFEIAKKSHNFLNALNNLGVQIDMDYGIMYRDYLFVQLSLTDALVNQLASQYNVNLSYINPNYSSDDLQLRWRFFQTQLDLKDASSIFSRAPFFRLILIGVRNVYKRDELDARPQTHEGPVDQFFSTASVITVDADPYHTPPETPKKSPKKSPEKSPKKGRKKVAYKPVPETDQSMSNDVDYVLVIPKKKLANFEMAKKCHNFLNALNDAGVKVDMDYGIMYSDYLFVRLTLTDALINQLTSQYNVDLSYVNPNYSSDDHKLGCRLFQTQLDLKDASSIFSRAPDTLMDLRPTKATKAERSMLLHILMSKTWFDADVNDYGIDKLMSMGVVAHAYPLHDGQHYWTQEGPLSDRQLLVKYWASFLCIYKNQPLNLIEKYFGTKVAMYFAFMDFYIRYMIPAAFVGVIVYFVGLLMAHLVNYKIIEDEICNSNLTLCPICADTTHCKYTEYNIYCDAEKTRVVLDTVFSAFYGIFISAWGVFFVFFWKRRLNILRMRWNVLRVRTDKEIRPEFVKKAKHTRTNMTTGQQEHYVPRVIRCVTLTCTTFCILFVALLIILFAMSVLVFQNRLSHYAKYSNSEEMVYHASLAKKIVTSLTMLLQMYGFAAWLPMAASFLTKIEVPSTQYNYDHSYITKHSILLFANKFTAIFYTTFIRGRAYEHPGKVKDYYLIGEFAQDLCGPSGCFTDLGISLGSIFVASSIDSFIKQLIKLVAKVIMRKRYHTKDLPSLPQWELDFALLPMGRLFLYMDFFDIVSQYAYIICFVSAFPLAPFFAIIRNAFKIRLDAIRFTRMYRKTTPKKSRGLGSYNKILSWVTHIGIFINGCVIAFSGSTISWFLYKFYFKTEGGYTKFMLSGSLEYNTAELLSNSTPPSPDQGICYYAGIRNPPNSPNKYEHRTDFYIITIAQLVFLIVYEQLLIFLRGLLRGSLHEKPRIFKERVLLEEDVVKEVKLKLLNELYSDKSRLSFPDKIHFPRS